MSAVISEDDACYALDLVKTICSEVGPGLPGSSQERKRAAIIRNELASHLGDGNVAIEEFTLAPDAFLGSLPISALLMLFAVLLNISTGYFKEIPLWASAAAALVFAVGSVLPFILEYLLYMEFLDLFFKKRQSVNVIATLRKPETRDVKQLLILSGHHDSPLENRWIRFLGYGFYITLPTLILAFVVIVVLCAIQLAGAIAGNAGTVSLGTVSWILLIYPFGPAIIFAAFFNMGRKNGGTVPGAADNLSASALAVAMCRFLVANPSCVPDDTEIRFVSFGGEEAGLRGSRRYVERHLEELKRLDARLLNYETVAYPEISILTSDINGAVRNSPEIVACVAAAAARAGVPYKVAPYAFGTGGSDAGPFTQAGLEATTLLPFKMPQQIVSFYHQKWDTPEVLTLEPLLNVLKLTLEWISHGGK